MRRAWTPHRRATALEREGGHADRLARPLGVGKVMPRYLPDDEPLDQRVFLVMLLVMVISVIVLWLLAMTIS